MIIDRDGAGPAIELGNSFGKPVLVTLAITSIVEQESIELSIWGSTDGVSWGTKPLVNFPQKFYCGAYSLMVNLSSHREIKHLRVQWKVNRWGRGNRKPMFAFSVMAEEIAVQAAVA